MNIPTAKQLSFRIFAGLLVLPLWFFVPAFGIVITIIAIGLLLIFRLKIPVTRGLIISLLLLICYIGAFEFVASALAPDTANFSILSLSLLLVSFSTLWFLSSSRVQYTTRSIIASISWREEAIPLLLAGIAVIFFAVPMFHPRDAAVSISFFSVGEDNASHMAMMNYGIKNQHAPYFTKKDTGIFTTLNVYPQGLHSSFAFFYHQIFGQDPSSNKKLVIYSFAMLWSVFTFIYMVAVVCLRLLNKSPYRFLAAILICALLLLFQLADLVTYGFLTQIFAYSLLLCLLIVVQDKILTQRKNSLSLVVITSLLILGVIFSWYLLAPIATLLVLAPYCRIIFKERLLWHAAIIFLATFIALGIFVINVTGPASGTLNTPGGVAVYEKWVYATAIYSIVLYAIYRLFTSRLKQGPFDVFAYSSLLLVMSIGAYQLVSVHEFRYYFYKSMYLIVIIGLLTGFALIAQLARKAGARHAVCITVCLLLVASNYFSISRPAYLTAYINDQYARNFQPEAIRSAIQNDQLIGHSDVVFVGNCTPTLKYILNRWTGALYLSEYPERALLYGRSMLAPGTADTLYRTYAENNGSVAMIEANCPAVFE